MKTIVIFLFVSLLSIGSDDVNKIKKLDFQKCVEQKVVVESSNKFSTVRQITDEEFIQKIGHLESLNNWKAVNTHNYIGEYQFGYLALRDVGYKRSTAKVILRKFKYKPSIWPKFEQDQAMCVLVSNNRQYLKKEIEIFSDSVINGYRITDAALLAAAHLGGNKNVKRYLYSNGKNIKKDAYGTSIEEYISKFQYYKINNDLPNRATLSNI